MSSVTTTVGWVEVRDAALRATRWGWPIVPGTFLGTDRHWHGRDGATGLSPISDTWQHSPVTDPADAYEIWSEHPYSVLLVCGRGVDVLELPEELSGLLPAPEVPQLPLATTARPPMRLSTPRARSRHRLPSRWCHLEDEDHREVVTVAQLLEANQDQRVWSRAWWSRLIRFRPQYPSLPSWAAGISQPRAPADETW